MFWNRIEISQGGKENTVSARFIEFGIVINKHPIRIQLKNFPMPKVDFYIKTLYFCLANFRIKRLIRISQALRLKSDGHSNLILGWVKTK